MKLIVLDRDGVINHESKQFIKSPEEWIPITGSIEAIVRLYQAHYRIIIATNQSSLSLGNLNIITLNAIHKKMYDTVQQAGANIDAIFFCPHRTSDQCICRKPKTGMLNEIAKRFNIHLNNKIATVGDSLRDLQASYNAGCTPYLVLTGNGKSTHNAGNLPLHTKIFPNLASVTTHLLY